MKFNLIESVDTGLWGNGSSSNLTDVMRKLVSLSNALPSFHVNDIFSKGD